MNTKKLLVLLGTLVVAAVIISACATAGEPGAQGPAGPAGPAGPQGEAGAPAMAADLTCTECHNDTALITGKKAPWSTSVHGSGTAAEYAGGRDGCTGCHSGASFSKMVAAGQTPATYDGTAADVTHQDCRTCHQIHTSFTGDDWALETTAAVELYAYEGVTFDGGDGNLCGVCHQPRRAFAPVDGMVDWNSTHYGPHHGPQTAVLLGVAGAGEAAEGKPGAHYSMADNTCVTCHLGENDNHTFLPTIAACQECHSDAENFDIGGLQTEVEAKLAELHELLVAKGMLTEDGTSIVGVYPEADAAALWNYILIAEEDKSMGVHNPSYINALLDASIATLAGE